MVGVNPTYACSWLYEHRNTLGAISKLLMTRVGQNHIFTVYIQYSWQGNHQICGHNTCIYTALANPTHKWQLVLMNDSWMLSAKYSWRTPGAVTKRTWFRTWSRTNLECYQQSTYEEHLVPSQTEHDLGHGQEQTLRAISKVLMKNTWYRHKKSMI